MNTKNVKTAALIPTKNEAWGIGKLIDILKKNEYVDKVIVIDGNSSDGTAKVAKYHGADIFCGEGKGKGYDFRLFQDYIQKKPSRYDIYVMLDGDMTYDPNDVDKIIEPIQRGQADVVVGSRHDKIKADPDAIKNVTRVGNYILTRTAGFLYRRSDVTDICSGYWGFSENFLRNAPLISNKFDLECDLFTYAVSNYRLKTVPINFRKRVGKEKLSLLGACKIPFYFAKYYGLNLLRNSVKQPSQESPLEDQTTAIPYNSILQQEPV